MCVCVLFSPSCFPFANLHPKSRTLQTTKSYDICQKEVLTTLITEQKKLLNGMPIILK